MASWILVSIVSNNGLPHVRRHGKCPFVHTLVCERSRPFALAPMLIKQTMLSNKQYLFLFIYLFYFILFIYLFIFFIFFFFGGGGGGCVCDNMWTLNQVSLLRTFVLFPVGDGLFTTNDQDGELSTMGRMGHLLFYVRPFGGRRFCVTD